LKILKDLSAYFDFVLYEPGATKKKKTLSNSVTVIPADPTIDISDLSDIFTGLNADAKQLRSKAWQR